MAYAPASIPNCQAISVGLTAVAVTVPVDQYLDLGVLLLQRGTDAGSVFFSWDPNVTTSTGVLISKSAPETGAQYALPEEAFNKTKTFYLIATSASQTVDVVMV